MIDKSKATYLKYRDRARDLYERGAVAHGDRHGTNKILEQVTVPLNANVQICEDGAFVEAVVWVPIENLERPTGTARSLEARVDEVGEALRLVLADERPAAPPDSGGTAKKGL